MFKEFSGLSENEKFASTARGKIQKAVNTRLNRAAGIDKKNNIKNGVAKKLLNTFTPDELMEIGHLYSPLMALSNNWFRRALEGLIAMQPSKQKFSGIMRAMLVTSMNVFQLSRKSKELLINGLIYGTTPDLKKKDSGIENDETRKRKEKYSSSSYYFVSSLARENFYLNMKENDPKFPDYELIFTHLNNKYAADHFENMLNDPKLDDKSKQYVEITLRGAIQTARYLNYLINGLINEKTELNSLPTAIRGYLSKYTPEKGTKEDQSVLIARVLKDVATYIDADEEELKRLFSQSGIEVILRS